MNAWNGLLSLTFLTCLTACSTEPDPAAAAAVAVKVTAVDLNAGSVSGSVQNLGERALWYGGCWAGLESELDGVWTRVPSDWACDMVRSELEPGKSASFELELPTSASTCRLRVSVGLLPSADPTAHPKVTAVSDPFCPDE